MFNLEKAVRRWREDLQYRSSLSPRELDEFEDHLRARMDLEQELNPERTRAQAFAAADQEMGDPQALSSEFAKAGRPRWKGLLVAGWALFAASFMMPTFDRPFLFRPPPPPPSMVTTVPAPLPDPVPEHMPGWEVFLETMTGEMGPFGVLSALSNVLILVAGLGMLGRWKMHGRRWLGLMVGATGLNLLMWMPMFLYRLDGGYYVWVASFACVTVALWLREREWSAASVEKAAA